MRHYYSSNSTREKILVVQKLSDNQQESSVLFNHSGVSEFIWDPTSKYIAYLDTSDKSILYIISAEDGSSVSNYTFSLPISMLHWSPAGNFITFVARVYVGLTMSQSLEYSTTRDSTYHSNAMAFDKTPLYRWDTWMNVFFFFFFATFYILFLRVL